jgi:hypothetical protein
MLGQIMSEVGTAQADHRQRSGARSIAEIDQIRADLSRVSSEVNQLGTGIRNVEVKLRETDWTSRPHRAVRDQCCEISRSRSTMSTLKSVSAEASYRD